MTIINSYKTLENHFHELALLGETMAILHWDLSVVMPQGGNKARGEQLAFLKKLAHEKITSPEIGDLLIQVKEAETFNSLTDWQRANIAEMSRQYIHATALNSDLVVAHSKACSDCESVWREAKKHSDYAATLPYLEKLLKLTQEKGQAKAEKLKTTLYNALLDQFEPDGKAEDIEPVFNDYAAFLPDFLSNVLDHQAKQGTFANLDSIYPIERQKQLTHHMAKAVGFDFNAGRMDESAHPFSTGHRGDQRITVRYQEHEFAQGLMAVLHECGHALYEKNLPKEWALQPVGDARGMMIHESQSLIIEMQACRSAEFYKWATPHIQKLFPEHKNLTEQNLYRNATRVKPDFIRVEADEVTYPAHVILRFQLEKALLEDQMSLKDLPEAWNKGMENLLGITPPNHALGCMQDIHWFDGAWGYFPTYTLGAMSAAQFFQAATSQNPDILQSISKGNFEPLNSWLRENIHEKGSSMTSQQLLKSATGSTLNPEAFKAHLKARYLGET